MKKNFIKYIAALAVAPMLLSSCSDDFLNEIDPNRQTPTTFWTSEDNVMKGLSAVYNPFRRMTSRILWWVGRHHASSDAR